MVDLKDTAYDNPEFAEAADNFINVIRQYLAQVKAYKSPTAKELKSIADVVLEKRL